VSRALQINSSLQGWMARNTKPVPLAEKGWVITMKNVPTEPKLPQTGDNANPLLYLGIGALALITGVGVGLRGRKKKNKQ
jgi:LPXTG-motif cell wall-anchored protein